MQELDFFLQPFTSFFPNFQIIAKVNRNENLLTIVYKLLENLSEITIPALNTNPSRKNELWQETCLEFFLGLKDFPNYWEFNLSPSGDWNVYSFDNYRQGMQEEKAIASLPFTINKTETCLELAIALDLNQLMLAEKSLDLALTAVIKPKQGENSYWALIHSGLKADFHLRDSFIIQI